MARKNHITVIFKATCDCNINCPYCYDKASRAKFKKTKCSDEIISHTVKLLSDYADSVEWTWHGGEATTLGKEYYIEAQKHFYNNYTTDFHQTLQSNGFLMLDDHSWVDVLNDNGITLGLSYDTYTQALRVGSKYTQEELMKKYIDLLQYANKVSGMNSGALSVIHNKNIDKLIDMYEHLKQNLPGTAANYNLIFNAIGNEEHGLGITKEDYSRYFPQFVNHLIRDTTPLATMERLVGTYISNYCNSNDYSICNHSDCRKRWLGIQPDGTVTYCDREVADKYYIGNVLDFNSVDEIYASEGYSNILKDIATRFSNECSKCEFLPFCRGGCHTNHSTANNGYLDKCDTVICDSFKQNFATIIKALSELEVDTRLNPHIARLVINSPTLLLSEILAFLGELGYYVRKEYVEDWLKKDVEEMIDTDIFKLLMLFRGINEDAKHYYEEGRQDTLYAFRDDRRVLFNKLLNRNKDVILNLLNNIV